MIITEKEIIEARQRVQEAELKGEQQNWNDALLASPDLTVEQVKEWFNTGEPKQDVEVSVKWCACPHQRGKIATIVCGNCNLPPYWKTIVVNVTQSSDQQ